MKYRITKIYIKDFIPALEIVLILFSKGDSIVRALELA